jgi:hypothetical protein
VCILAACSDDLVDRDRVSNDGGPTSSDAGGGSSGSGDDGAAPVDSASGGSGGSSGAGSGSDGAIPVDGASGGSGGSSGAGSGSDGAAPVDGASGGSGGSSGAGPGNDGAVSSDGASGDGGGPTSATTAGVACTYSYDAYNSSASVLMDSVVTWSCSATTRSVTGNGIPDHDVGTFPNPNCPNSIAAQNLSASMTLTPVNTGTATNLGIGPVGIALNGVKFDPGTAGTCTESGSTTSCSLIGDTGTWHIEALGQTSFDFGVDVNNAHVQPDGTYHYHGMPVGFLSKHDAGFAPVLVGFALDGFPVYARYGYSSAMDATSPVKVMLGSYELKSTPDAGRPPTSTYPMGAFTEDYAYVAGSGDLDECNGRVDVTPEFPAGIYHYYITDTYPFIHRCIKGTQSPGSGGPPPGDGGSGGDGGGPGCTPSSCPANQVCCPSGQPCAGKCVPDCRMGPGCPSGLTCDMGTGICKP